MRLLNKHTVDRGTGFCQYKTIVKQCLATLYLGTDDTFAKIWIIYFQEEEEKQTGDYGNSSKTSLNILLR